MLLVHVTQGFNSLVDDNLFVAILLVDYVFKESLNLLDMLIAAIHLAKNITQLVSKKFRLFLFVKCSNQAINCFNSLEGLDTEQAVNTISHVALWV